MTGEAVEGVSPAMQRCAWGAGDLIGERSVRAVAGAACSATGLRKALCVCIGAGSDVVRELRSGCAARASPAVDGALRSDRARTPELESLPNRELPNTTGRRQSLKREQKSTRWEPEATSREREQRPVTGGGGRGLAWDVRRRWAQLLAVCAGAPLECPSSDAPGSCDAPCPRLLHEIQVRSFTILNCESPRGKSSPRIMQTQVHHSSLIYYSVATGWGTTCCFCQLNICFRKVEHLLQIYFFARECG